MQNKMWILIRDSDCAKEPWVGQITRAVVAKSPMRFELVRPVDFADLYRKEPFLAANNVIGLLDYQKPCTLIRPIVERIDPGRLDVKNKSQRTIITGVFQALLSDIPVEDGDEQKFLGFAFESESLDAWHGTLAFDHNFDFETRTTRLDIKPNETTTFTVVGLGRVTVTRTALLTSERRYSSVHSATVFKVEFEKPKSINEVMSLAFGLARLFGFLIGFRGPYPVFTTWTADKIKLGDTEVNYDGTLEIGSVDWSEGDGPHALSCVHLKGIADAELPSILERFLSREKDIVDQIHAVEFSRFFSRNLNDRFAVTMPVLDGYVQSRYKTSKEESFIAAQAEFFAYVDASPSMAVREFSKKHIKVHNKKAPGLKTLLSRAIAFVNSKGFCFDPVLASRIDDRRGRLFHAAPLMGKEEVRSFYLEVQAITGLLLLHTLTDLGIDIAYLADRYHALGDMRPFMRSLNQETETAETAASGPERGDKDGHP